ncbi:SagB/ThcOx family dehydrogenase [Companilactobacillus bobalius]|uniref:Nitroreductase domain-containing protein n=2 Tax=Companilactobacillus bobalius TaxID=2801451 RepID=A0A202F865_9LACO|nr:SagB/ThcOx family dehydrogenase [Companilactobacillus bobalius]GEO58376.1 hypothetical protein LBO01_15050 [Companilactobacillus paralimentarius]KAE9557668.1 hypothetical protein ATN92_16085 [Companilactobacillus bobalius]KAE9563814.1 hypothetical protein ATN92_03535 [Companilactobacillus bobalius]KRK83562.1 hypothetical protein FC78_GL001519 [Companilactobacillus bobalius DSM 19674]OVE96645.1 hypothetical protein LKACC16343_02314 [Companilactobacillus bobalius]
MKNKIIDIIDNNDIGSSDLLKYKRVWNTMEHGKKKKENFKYELVQNTSPFFTHDNQLKPIKLMKGYGIKSIREFQRIPMKREDLLKVISLSFCKGNQSNHRSYGSAGALYPIFPILIVTKDNIVEKLSRGIYVLDDDTQNLIYVSCGQELNKMAKYIYPYDENKKLPSDLMICYCFSLFRTTIKYGFRGFRHMLFEAGEMAEAFRLFGSREIPDFGDISWSGFDDEGVKKTIGISNISPVMIQFFGYRSN